MLIVARHRVVFRFRRRPLALAAIALVFFQCDPAARAQIVWNGGSLVDSNWSTSLNWGLGLAPSNPSLVVLQFAGSTRLTPNTDAAWTTLGVAFNSGASSFTLGGSDITLGASGLANNSANAQTVNNAVVLNVLQTWSATSGDLAVGGTVNNGGFLLTTSAASGKTLTLSGIVSGTGGITKSGAGTQILTGTNSYSGTTTVSAGTLTLNNSGGAAIGAGSIAINAGSLTFGSANQIAAGLNLTLAGGTLNAGNFASSNLLGTLALGSSSTIDFGGASGTAVFGNSSSITWTGTLTLNNFASGSSIKFGTTSGGLTGTQLSQIAATNFSSFGLDSSGFLTATAVPEPSTYAALFGAAALVGVAIKRRRKNAAPVVADALWKTFRAPRSRKGVMT